MYAIKIMSGENLPDSDVAKGFKIILVDAGDTFEFGHNSSGEPVVTVSTVRDGEHVSGETLLTGNAYVMSETGKTVASFWGNKKVVKVTIDPLDSYPASTIDIIKNEASNEFIAREAVVNTVLSPFHDIKEYSHEQLRWMSEEDRRKAYRSNVDIRMKAGCTEVSATQAEMYIFQ